MRNKFSKFLILGFTFYLLPFTLSIAETLDKVIVVVNGETITQSELEVASDAVVKRLEEKFKGEELAKEIEVAKREILNRMVEEKLILSEAKKQKVEVNDLEVEEKLKEVKSRFGSEQEFDEALKEGDVSLKELKERYADQIRIARLVEMEVRKKILVTPSEVLEYYNLHKEEEYLEPEQIRLKNILIKVEADLKDEDAQILAEKILSFLKAGEGFDELALKYSKGPNVDIGGDLGYVKRGQMLKEIEEVVFGLEAGQFSDVVKTALGYHIFRVEEKRPERLKELNEAKAQIEKVLFAKKGKQRYGEWIEGLRKDAYISFR